MSLMQTKSHIMKAFRGVHLTHILKHNYLLGVISIANRGWWTLIRSTTYNSKSICLQAREERAQNANYLIINI